MDKIHITLPSAIDAILILTFIVSQSDYILPLSVFLSVRLH